MKRRQTIGIPLLLAGTVTSTIIGSTTVMGCLNKKGTPSIDVPQNEVSPDQLCVEVEPQSAQVLLNSTQIPGNSCQVITGEVLLQVTEAGYAPFLENISMDGQGTVSRKIVLKPAMEFRSGNLMPPPMPTLQEFCITVVPEDAFILINGRKVISGTCMPVQPAVDIKIEAEGFEKHVELFAMPQDQKTVERQVVLTPSKAPTKEAP